VGTKIHTTSRFLGRKLEATLECIEVEPNKRIVNRADKPFVLVGTHTYESDGGGTRIVSVFEGSPGGFFKLAEPLAARIFHKRTQADLETMKEILEAQVPAQRPNA
jgi:hypothetical protein